MSKFPDLLGSSNTAFQLGIGGAQVRSSSGKIQARNAANNALATLECADLIVNSNRVTVSDTAPNSPVTGDRWYETSSGALKYGWHWCWNGTYWLSPQQYWDSSVFSISAAFSDLYFNLDTTHNIFLNSWRVNPLVLTTNSSVSYWTIALARRTTANVLTTIDSLSTSTSSPDVWVPSSLLSINTHVDLTSTSARVLSVRFSKAGSTGTPGNISCAVKLLYQLARV